MSYSEAEWMSSPGVGGNCGGVEILGESNGMDVGVFSGVTELYLRTVGGLSVFLWFLRVVVRWG